MPNDQRAGDDVTSKVWNEDDLRADIVSVWGEYGAHIDVFDFMVKEIERLREVLVFADGFVVQSTRYGKHPMCLADLYNETTPHQAVIARAGCHERGKFRGR